MTAGDQFSDGQPYISDLVVPTPNAGIVAAMLAVLDECGKDPYGFVENEHIQRGE